MKDWMEGYESDIEYTANYYREQDPDFLSLCALMHGAESVDVEQSFTYCELGCGQGITSLIMAANYPQGTFYAIDFNPSHIARASRLAAKAGLTNIVFLEKSFAQLVEDSTLLPMCDFITMHGIFSWVNDQNRRYIVDILNRHLSAGGIVYNGYNVKPGCMVGEVFQKMILLGGDLGGGDSVNRIKHALSMLNRFKDVDPAFFKLYQSVVKQYFQLFPEKDISYLVHEYLNDEWRAFYFDEIAGYLSSAKLEYVGGASLSDSYIDRFIDGKQQDFLKGISDATTRELFKDILLNTSFRRDIFMRGCSSRLSIPEKFQALSHRKWILLDAKIYEKNFTFKVPMGEIVGNQDLYRPIVDVLANEPADLKLLLNKTGLDAANILLAIMLLSQGNVIAPYKDNVDDNRIVRLNKILCSQMFNSMSTNFISLPRSGLATYLKSQEMLFYRIILDRGMIDSESLVREAYRHLQAYGKNPKRDGIELNSHEAITYLRELESQWRQNVLPTLIKFKAFS